MANKEITLDELHKHLKQLGREEVVLDVRRTDEFAQGHIPGSINFSHENIGQHIEQLKAYKTIYIHCKAGGRAKKAFETLAALGFTNLVCISDAGMDAWRERGYPVEN